MFGMDYLKLQPLLNSTNMYMVVDEKKRVLNLYNIESKTFYDIYIQDPRFYKWNKSHGNLSAKYIQEQWNEGNLVIDISD